MIWHAASYGSHLPRRPPFLSFAPALTLAFLTFWPQCTFPVIVHDILKNTILPCLCCHFCKYAHFFESLVTSSEPRMLFLFISLTCRNSVQPLKLSFITASNMLAAPFSLPKFCIYENTLFFVLS